MKQTDDQSQFEARLRIDNLPPEGRTLTVSPSEEERVRLAELLGITSVDSFSADLTVSRFRGGIRALGKLHAGIVQPCVVTFEAVSQTIDETVDRVFLPRSESNHAPGAEVFVALEGEDDPDPLEGPEVDFSPMLTEILALAIDPYPRAAGATLEELWLGSEGPDVSPFAALNSLKNKGD